jgi:hypothetical protein
MQLYKKNIFYFFYALYGLLSAVLLKNTFFRKQKFKFGLLFFALQGSYGLKAQQSPVRGGCYMVAHKITTYEIGISDKINTSPISSNALGLRLGSIRNLISYGFDFEFQLSDKTSFTGPYFRFYPYTGSWLSATVEANFLLNLKNANQSMATSSLGLLFFKKGIAGIELAGEYQFPFANSSISAFYPVIRLHYYFRHSKRDI